VPGLPDDEVTVTASRIVGRSPGSWFVTAYAICVDDLVFTQTPDASTATNSDSPKQQPVPCGLAGLFVHSMGFEILGAAGQVVLTNLSTVGGRETSVTATAFEHGDTTSSWRLKTYAVCHT
jgi:hypothetical protein